MDKAPAYGAGDSGFESQYGLHHFFLPSLATAKPVTSFFGTGLWCSASTRWLSISRAEELASPGLPRKPVLPTD